jgi:hypothetical protein
MNSHLSNGHARPNGSGFTDVRELLGLDRPQPWPHGMPSTLGLRRDRLTVLGHPAPRHDLPDQIATVHLLTLDDIVHAARTLLRLYHELDQMGWHTEREHDEDEIVLLVKHSRAKALDKEPRDILTADLPTDTLERLRTRVGATRGRYLEEALLHAFHIPISAVVSTLAQLGLDADTSPDGEFVAGFGLIDRPEWFDGIREGHIPPSAVPALHAALGEEKFSLLLDLRYDHDALTHAATDPDRLTVDALRTLRALRA